MKYKILITGNNDSAIDDFFVQMNDNFEAMTTSIRYEDVIRHINYFSPDIFICCLYNESRDDINQIASVNYRLSQSRIPFVLIGSKENCDEFQRIAVNVSDLTLHRPISVSAIQERLLKLMESRGAGETSAGKSEGLPTTESIYADPSYAQLLSALGQFSDQGIGTPQRKHILVVDDNSMMLKVIKEHLHEKYDVATAVNGKIALKFLERKKTDLILLDYEMPGENGPAVLEKLRASETTKDIPVIFLTGVTETKKIQEALILKPQSYLLKPIDREKLLEAIAKIIG